VHHSFRAFLVRLVCTVAYVHPFANAEVHSQRVCPLCQESGLWVVVLVPKRVCTCYQEPQLGIVHVLQLRIVLVQSFAPKACAAKTFQWWRQYAEAHYLRTSTCHKRTHKHTQCAMLLQKSTSQACAACLKPFQ